MHIYIHTETHFNPCILSLFIGLFVCLSCLLVIFHVLIAANLYSSFTVCSADGNYAILGGQWSIDDSPSQLLTGSPNCDPSSYKVNTPVYSPTCTSGIASACSSVIPTDQCYCTTYGHDDQCYIQYYMQQFNGAVTPLPSNPNSNQFRGGQTTYWHKFEFVMDFTVTNYAMLSTTLPL